MESENEELLTVVWWCFMCSLCLGSQPNHSHQCYALYEFREGVKYNESTSKVASWNPDTDCCSWNGITCNATTGNVIGLDLSRSGLFGEINSSNRLFHLFHLHILNLGHNDLVSSKIPSAFGHLSSLTHLNLSQKLFYGQIPKEISLLKNLVSFDISNTVGELKLENPTLGRLIRGLSRLKELHLNRVNMLGHINSDWCEAISSALPELQVLSLSSSNLSGPITPSILNLRFLTHLYLDSNDITQLPTEIFALPNLQVLDMSWNIADKGIRLPEFPQKATLQHLMLFESNLLGKIPDSIGNLKFLKTLNIYNTNLSGPIPSTFGILTQLVFLDLSANKFNDHILFSFENFYKLEYLDMSENNFSGPIPPLKSPSNTITYINLSKNRFTGPIPSSYVNGLPNLSSLQLQKNSISGEIPSSMFVLPSLKAIFLSENQLNGELKEFVGTSFSSSLEVIDLSINELQGSIPSSLFKNPSLQVLDMQSNNFSGLVDSQLFENLRSLYYLDLSNNTGLDIKSSTNISLMPNLSFLQLSYCNLSKFPEFFRNQEKLLVVDISMNRIQGQIPNWLWTKHLSYLNLSHNLLNNFERPLTNLSLSNLRLLDLRNNSIQATLPNLPPYLSFQQ